MDLIGIVTGPFRDAVKWFRRPKLRIYFDAEKTGERIRTRVPSRPPQRGITADGNVVEVNPEGVWYHLQVSNRGHRIASECRALIDMVEEEIDGEWQRLPAFRARIPVAWANTGAELVLDVHGRRTERIDLGCVLDGEQMFHFHSPLPPSGIIRGLPVGRYRLTVVILSRDAGSASMRVVVDFGGDADSVTITPEA